MASHKPHSLSTNTRRSAVLAGHPIRFTKAALKRAGFTGFVSVEALVVPTERRAIPQENGVYVVLYHGADPPAFTMRSTAGWFKGRDPTLPVVRLDRRWVIGAEVVYIGRATKTRRTNLRARVRALVRYGTGHRIGHEGGRALWQLPGSTSLMVAWRTAETAQEAILAERELIDDFRRQYKALPFANVI